MTMTLDDWDKEVKSIDDKQKLIELRHALRTLRHWEAFRKEFGGTGLFVLEISIFYEICRRSDPVLEALYPMNDMDAVDFLMDLESQLENEK